MSNQIWFTLGCVILGAIIANHFKPYDSTDDVENSERSGMILYTDHETGCQYLSRPLGGLTPRLDYDGTHKGCRR